MADEFQYIKLPDGSYGKFPATADDAFIQSAIAKDFPDAYKQPVPAEQPSFLQRLSEVTLGTQHPVNQAVSEAKQLYNDPLGTLAQTAKQVGKTLAIDIPTALVVHPIKTLQNLTGGPQFAQDIQSGNFGGAAGALTGGMVNTLLPAKIAGAGETAASVLNDIEKMVGKRRVNVATERVFRGANPPGSQIRFRDNLEAAIGDLAEIERSTPTTGRGGFVNPDMRIRSVAENIDSHLNRIYEQERAAPIRQAALQNGSVMLRDTPQVMKDATATIGLVADSPLQSVLSQIAGNPRLPIPIEQADALAKVVNKELLRFEKMSPSEQATAAIKSSDIASLKRLDMELSQSINGELNRLGLPDIANYERRYAALSNIRDVLRGQMNTAEKIRLWQRVGEWVSIRGGGGARLGGLQPSAGRLVQKGMKGLAKSGLTPARSIGPEAAPPRRLLPAQATGTIPSPESQFLGINPETGYWPAPRSLTKNK